MTIRYRDMHTGRSVSYTHLDVYKRQINQRVMKRPLVIEEERINFGKDVDVKKVCEEDKGGAEA